MDTRTLPEEKFVVIIVRKEKIQQETVDMARISKNDQCGEFGHKKTTYILGFGQEVCAVNCNEKSA